MEESKNHTCSIRLKPLQPYNRAVRLTQAFMKVGGAPRYVDYAYDRNGNMTSDANKGISLFWDTNNRLKKVNIAFDNYISFTRSASGGKLSMTNRTPAKKPSIGLGRPWVATTTVTHYYGAYEYRGGRFSRLNTATGYRDSLGVYVYVRDWQGNIRAVVRKGADGKAVLEQATYYYPYGMPMAESTNPTLNRYKYTGKELLTDKGFNCYDFGPRPYDPTTGIWWSVDEHSADYAPISHYSMCDGDPINHIDPNGKDVYILSSTGHFDLKMKTPYNYDLIKVENSKETITLSKDFMDSQKTQTGVSGGMNVSVDYYYTNSPNEDYFKFFAGNTDVEWSRIEFSDGSSVIGTAHEHGSEGTPGVVLQVFKDILNTITKFDHTHTNRVTQPSDADVRMAMELENHAPAVLCRIFWNYDFDISTIYDSTYDTSQPYEFEELIVKPK